MTEQLDTIQREQFAAARRARPANNPRGVLAGVRIRGLGIAGGNGLGQLVPKPRPAIADGIEYNYLFKEADDAYRVGNYQEAAGIYLDLITKYPRAMAAYLRRGDCYLMLQDFDKAIADYQMAIPVVPLAPRAYLGRGWAHLGKGETDLAMTDAAEAIRLQPMLAEAHLICVEAFARKGQPDQAAAERGSRSRVLSPRGGLHHQARL